MFLQLLLLLILLGPDSSLQLQETQEDRAKETTTSLLNHSQRQEDEYNIDTGPPERLNYSAKAPQLLPVARILRQRRSAGPTTAEPITLEATIRDSAVLDAGGAATGNLSTELVSVPLTEELVTVPLTEELVSVPLTEEVVTVIPPTMEHPSTEWPTEEVTWPADTVGLATEPTATEALSMKALLTEPTATEALSTEPTATEALSTEPAATEALSTEPAATEALATEPAATEALATEPAATEALATEPAATEALATEPAATEALATEPAATEALSTEPAATEALSTESAATEALSTESAAMEALSTEPTATEALSIEPRVIKSLSLELATTAASSMEPTTAGALPTDPATMKALPTRPATTRGLTTALPVPSDPPKSSNVPASISCTAPSPTEGLLDPSSVKQCLLAILILALVATIFLVCTVVLAIRLSRKNHLYPVRDYSPTEMVCISSLLPEGGEVSTATANGGLPKAKSQGLKAGHGADHEGDDLTLHSFLP
ncbi:P-selectin glycoprotein ligand 1 [Hippopotamus amphibius kiboko]|uniref:P-selectin glycoprotein ligand 1 n=1 Tax=Hippopotamus amphibius kiboko TaxID=575201 RepID=UPI002595732D|nr:P-selectin glycoprotein ligand 1 [Hippopotamus amphibius kiboko]